MSEPGDPISDEDIVTEWFGDDDDDRADDDEDRPWKRDA